MAGGGAAMVGLVLGELLFRWFLALGLETSMFSIWSWLIWSMASLLLPALIAASLFLVWLARYGKGANLAPQEGAG